MASLLEVNNISKKISDISILNEISFKLNAGDSLAVIGQSGSGKSTLLQICGLLTEPTSGTILIQGKNCTKSSDNTKTRIRRENIGFVYQFHHLLKEFSVLENLIIPQLIYGKSRKEAIDHAISYLKILGMSDYAHKSTNELSGGEKQRIAVIRSIINNPKLILADEPTGNLDEMNAKKVTELFLESTSISKAAVIIVTHNKEIAKLFSKTLHLEKGSLV